MPLKELAAVALPVTPSLEFPRPPMVGLPQPISGPYAIPPGTYALLLFNGWAYFFQIGTYITIAEDATPAGRPLYHIYVYQNASAFFSGEKPVYDVIVFQGTQITYAPVFKPSETVSAAKKSPTSGPPSATGPGWIRGPEDPWPGGGPPGEAPPIKGYDPLAPEDPWGNDLGINLTDRERGLFGSRNPRGLGEIFGHLLPGHGGGGKTTPSGPGSRSSADPTGGGGGGSSPSDGGRGDVWSDPGDPGGSSPTTTPTPPGGSGGGDLDIAGVVEAAQSGAGTGAPSVDDSSGTISGQKPDGSWSKPQRFPKLRPDPSEDGPVTSADPIALVVTGAALKLGASMMGRLRAPRSDGPLDDGERQATASGSTKVRPVDPALDPVPYAVNASTAGGGGSVGGLTQVGVGSGPIRALRPDLDSPNERGRTDEATTIVDRFTTIAGAGGTLGGAGDPVAGGGGVRTVRGGVLTSADGKSRR